MTAFRRHPRPSRLARISRELAGIHPALAVIGGASVRHSWCTLGVTENRDGKSAGSDGRVESRNFFLAYSSPAHIPEPH